MANGYVYRSHADLQGLGQRIVYKAAEVVLWQDESYSMAQQGSINDYTKSQMPSEPTANPHYQPPASGEPSDIPNVQEYVRQALADVPQYFTAFSVPDPDSVNESVTTPLYRTSGTLVPSLRLTRKGGEQLFTDTLAGADAHPHEVLDRRRRDEEAVALRPTVSCQQRLLAWRKSLLRLCTMPRSLISVSTLVPR